MLIPPLKNKKPIEILKLNERLKNEVFSPNYRNPNSLFKC